jgi:hypothetical protein
MRAANAFELLREGSIIRTNLVRDGKVVRTCIFDARVVPERFRSIRLDGPSSLPRMEMYRPSGCVRSATVSVRMQGRLDQQ